MDAPGRSPARSRPGAALGFDIPGERGLPAAEEHAAAIALDHASRRDWSVSASAGPRSRAPTAVQPYSPRPAPPAAQRAARRRDHRFDRGTRSACSPPIGSARHCSTEDRRAADRDDHRPARARDPTQRGQAGGAVTSHCPADDGRRRRHDRHRASPPLFGTVRVTRSRDRRQGLRRLG